MEMEILVDYSIGAGGSVNVFYQGQIFRLIYLKEDDNDYADINYLLGDSMDETLINVIIVILYLIMIMTIMKN